MNGGWECGCNVSRDLVQKCRSDDMITLLVMSVILINWSDCRFGGSVVPITQQQSRRLVRTSF